MASLEFWYEFASTYSYPAAMRIQKRAAARGVEIVWRPFLLGPIFGAQGWTTSPFNLYPAKGRYMWRDMERICQRESLPFRRPDPFPQSTLLAARIATALEGEDREKFSRAVYESEFGSGLSIDSAERLGALLKTCGISGDFLGHANTESNRAALRASVEEAIRRGIFGAPSFVASDGELFWGYDRLEEALDWAVKRA